MVMATTASMSRNNNKSVPTPFGQNLLAILCAFAGATASADWNANLTVGGYYSDNILLVRSPNESDDIALWVSPDFSYEYESPTLDANAAYQFDWIRYQDLDSETRYHNAIASLTAKAFDEAAQFEIGGSRSQTIRDPNRVIPPSRLPISENLIDVDQYYANPRFSTPLGANGSLSGSYRYSVRRYDESNFQGNDDQDAELGFDNYRRGRGLAWAVRYQWARTDYEVSPLPWQFQRASIELGFWTSASTRVFGSFGNESPWDSPTDDSLDDEFWEVGFAYSPGENTSLELAYGERDYGDSYRGSFEHKMRRGGISLSYEEQPTTFGRRPGPGIFRPAQLPLPSGQGIGNDDLDEFIGEPGTTERYISNLLQGVLTLELRNLDVWITIFDEERTGRVQASGDFLEDQTQSGLRANLSWQAGSRTSFGAFAEIVDRDIDEFQNSEYINVGVGVDYQLGVRTTLALTYSYAEEQPGEGSQGPDYFANSVLLSATIGYSN